MSTEDYARAVGAPRSIQIGDSEYRVSRFTPRDIGDLQAWLKDQVPDPRLKAKQLIEGVPDAVAIEIWRTLAEEAKDWPPTLSSDLGNQLLTTTTDGVARLLWVILRKFNNIDLAKARGLAEQISMDELGQILRLASPEGDVPKASTEAKTNGPISTHTKNFVRN